ncbi:response regulator transcription factor [Tumebacillus permanentifrigoris]|uniref:DNA-binding response OmpR family regulator n=1 Tax=Tumebacillus permanentifrigoris TaxID=378543 RepID=A0A316DF81_9BACL|nr:response regulator transcription factor [Tumebacillus permanentifrigoris]PWK15849.1 DNA-binding response OmpR family regulator [Tumebacillus permanentifrigoris]
MRQNPIILVVEDDESIALLMRLYLEKEGFEFVHAVDGEQALHLYRRLRPSLVVLDLMIPKIDGHAVCKQIRREGTTPIIMVTAKTQSQDKLLGFDLGADDYLGKPFDPPELVARVKAVLRRSQPKVAKQLRYEGLLIDLDDYVVEVDCERIVLPPKEMDLLHFIASHPNQVFDREHILGKVWGAEYEGDNRTVDVHVKRLREKIERPDLPWSIRTVWGVGYKFEVQKP